MFTSWKEFLERTDIVGGDLELDRNGVCRGPISDLRDEGSSVALILPWSAKFVDGKWQVSHGGSNYIPKDVKLRDIGLGRFEFDRPLIGKMTIFLKGSSGKLDPAEVEGLDFESA